MHSLTTRFSPLKSLMLVLLVTSGCQSWKVERVVKLTDSEANRPMAGRTLLFFGEKGPWKIVEVSAKLDGGGEARVRLQQLRWWARLDELDGTTFGKTITPSDFQNGGVFRLYGRPPTPTDTNLYPSKFVLEIRKP